MALGGNGVVLARFARRNGEPIEAVVVIFLRKQGEDFDWFLFS
jgi:hypothetical protein